MVSSKSRRPKGSGTIVQRGNLYRGQKTVRGEKLSTPWVTSRTAAERELAAMGAVPKSPKRSLGECFERSLPQRRVSPNTAHEYRRLFYAYAGKFANRSIDSITTDEVGEIYDGMAHLRKQTRNQMRVNLARAFEYAIEKKWMDSNPARMTGLGSAPAPRAFDALPVSDARSLIKRLRVLALSGEEPLASMYMVGLAYGLRANERRGLCWDEVDLTGPRPMITIRSKLVDERGRGAVWKEETKSASGLRRIQLESPFLDVLEKRLELSRKMPPWRDQDGIERDLVWRQENGQPITTTFERRDWRRIQTDAGITKTIAPTGMRHTAATILIAPRKAGGVGLDVLSVSRILGHTDIRLVDRTYAKRIDETYAAAAEAYEKDFWDAQVNLFD